MCLTKAIKKFITWKDPLSIFICISSLSVFVFGDKGKAVLCHRLLQLKETLWWHWRCGELGLILGGWHLSEVLWYGGSVTSSEIPLLFPRSLYILHSSPLPSLTIKPCIKDSYGTYSVFRIHYAPAALFLLVHSALYLLPLPITLKLPPYQWIPTNKDT